MKPIVSVFMLACAGVLSLTMVHAQPLGLPRVPVPEDNPQSPEKIALGDKLFNDKRFSSTGAVSCATCHDPQKAFTDSPLVTSEGVNKLTGTRNAPTVVNAAYYKLFFWDGRSLDLEDQAQHPMVNPVEMGLPTHDPVLSIVRTDPEYVAAFRKAFSKEPAQITMKEVQQAIASFERTIVSGDAPFDRWYFGGDQQAIPEQAKRGFDVFMNKGALRILSCHRRRSGAIHGQSLPQHRRGREPDPERDLPARSGLPQGESDWRGRGQDCPCESESLRARAICRDGDA